MKEWIGGFLFRFIAIFIISVVLLAIAIIFIHFDFINALAGSVITSFFAALVMNDGS